MEIGVARLPEHQEAIQGLIDEIGIAEGHPPLGEHKYLALHRPQEGMAGVGGWVEGRLVAFAPLARDGAGRHVTELVVAPLFRRTPNYQEILAGAVALARAEGGKELRVWIFHPGGVAAAVALGFVEERQLLRLEIDLPVAEIPDYPDAIEIVPFRPGEDEEAWLELNKRAFARHPENGSWGLTELAERMAQDWFSPENLLMAWDRDRLVGFNWLKPTEDLGEIYVIAVDPNAQGGGLGRALLLDGLRRLGQLGSRRACLYVDADNQRALRLYRDVGFFLDDVDQTLVKEL